MSEKNRIKAKTISDSEREQYKIRHADLPNRYNIADIMTAEETGYSVAFCWEAPYIKHGFDRLKQIDADAAAILLDPSNEHVFVRHMRYLGVKRVPNVAIEEYAGAIKADDVVRMCQIAGCRSAKRSEPEERPAKGKVLASVNLQQQCNESARAIYHIIHNLPQCRKEVLSKEEKERMTIDLRNLITFIERQIGELTT